MIRLKFNVEDTILQVKNQVHQNLSSSENSSGVGSLPSPDRLNLCLESNGGHSLDNQRTLKSLNLKNGVMVYLQGIVRDIGPEPSPHFFHSNPSTPKCPYHGPHGSCVKCLTAQMIRVSPQEKPKYSGVSLSRSAIEKFQSFVFSQLAFSVQRCGLLFASPPDEEGWVSVDFIYEPQQEGTENQIQILNPPDENQNNPKDLSEFQRVLLIAELLGLKMIGWVISHNWVDYRLSSPEMLLVSRLYKDVEPLVSLIISPDETGNVQCEAFELSEQYLELSRKREVFLPGEEQSDPKLHKAKTEIWFGNKECKEIDNDAFLIPLPIKDHQSILNTEFPIENRPQQGTVEFEFVRQYWRKKHSTNFVSRLADFHLLLWLLNHLDHDIMSQIIPLVASYCRGESYDSTTEGFELILDNFLQL